MDAGREQTETTKLLMEQKTLFCKLLLLEIEKYEQSLNKLNKSSTRKNVENRNNKILNDEDTKYDDNYYSGPKWTGFQSLDEVDEFGREYYHGVLKAITKKKI